MIFSVPVHGDISGICPLDLDLEVIMIELCHLPIGDAFLSILGILIHGKQNRPAVHVNG
jgi:hypothetical protein